jgi:hypothetical protein
VWVENNKLVAVLFLSIGLAVTTASASPTVTTGKTIATAKFDVADTPTAILPNNLKVIAPANSELAIIGRQLLKPSVNSAGLTNNPPDYVKALPAVPATCFMVLTGFLCISFVRDRRVWLAALAGLLWAGQAGIQAVPQLAMCVYRRAHTNKQLAAPLDRSSLLENTNRLRCDIEGTRFIGLLHYLEGIPTGKSGLITKQTGRINTSSLERMSLFARQRAYALGTGKTRSVSIPAIIPSKCCLEPLLSCFTARAEQHIRFSPAFFFDNLARGPPISA